MRRPTKKITIEVPEELLEKAMSQIQTNLTETIRQGLTLLAESSTYEKLKSFKGKGKFEFQWNALKEER